MMAAIEGFHCTPLHRIIVKFQCNEYLRLVAGVLFSCKPIRLQLYVVSWLPWYPGKGKEHLVATHSMQMYLIAMKGFSVHFVVF